jgi:aminoglycoside phosphotransferase (APT) family kinase protein
MHSAELHYLQGITRQLAGPIGAATNDPMATRLLYCTTQLLNSLVAERQTDSESPAASSSDGDRERWARIEQRFTHLEHGTGQYDDHEVEPMDAAQQARLEILLRERFAEGPQLRIDSINAIAGGFSKQTITLGLSGNQELPAHIVVRRDRAESPVGSTVLDEFELLQTLHQAGIKVPRPLLLDDGSVMGNPILVMERVEGGNIGDVYNLHAPATVSPKLATSLAGELARLHAIGLEQMPAKLPGLDVPYRAFLRQEIEGFQAHWQALGESAPTIEAAFAWLFAHIDQISEQRCLVHRDTRFHNILSQGEDLTALLDWELASVGVPARDLGYAYHHIVQFSDWQAFLSAYGAAGGVVPDALELNFYILWSDLFVAIYMYMARASYLASDGSNIQLAFAGERMRQHNMFLLSRRLQQITEDALQN